MLEYSLVMLGAYVLVGCALTLFGPLHRSITRSTEEVVGNPITNAILDRAPISSVKLLAFRLLLNAISIALWPVFLVSAVREQRRYKRAMGRSLIEGLYFHHMCGAGTIECQNCGFSASIVSYLHGWGGPDRIGFQCKSCRGFVTLERAHNAEPVENECPVCGGPVSRSEQLNCPQCGSNRPRYVMEIIT